MTPSREQPGDRQGVEGCLAERKSLERPGAGNFFVADDDDRNPGAAEDRERMQWKQ